MIKNKLLIIISILFIALFAATINLVAVTPDITGPDTVQKEKNQVLTLADILALYNSDLGGVSILSDDFTGNGATVGTYQIELVASDGTNQAVKTIEIEVLDKIGHSVRAVTDFINIHIAKNHELTALNIINVHERTGVVTTNATSQFEILTDNYSENKAVAGTYLFEYRLMDATGLDKTVSCNITVHASERLENPIVVNPPKEPSQFFKKLTNALSTIVILGAGIALGLFIIKFLRRQKK